MRKERRRDLIIGGLLLLLTGCVGWNQGANQKQTGSMVEYLFPDNANASMQPEASTTLQVPLRVGLAFVPSASWDNGLPEAERIRMLARVRDAFAAQTFISGIEIIPTAYLKAGGGFTNLEQAARLLNVDVVVLLSYDQVQFADNNVFSLLYWTIVGAYVIQGDRFDISTLLDAAVFDVKSRKLLFRAPGVSKIKGSSTLNNFSEQSRRARTEGYSKALDALIPELETQLNDFRARIKSGAEKDVHVQTRPGTGGGAFDLGGLVALSLVALLAVRLRRTSCR